MDYVLYWYAFIACGAAWAFCYTLGGSGTRAVLTVGLYLYSPHYRRPSGAPRFLSGHPDHRARSSLFDPLSPQSGLYPALYNGAYGDTETQELPRAEPDVTTILTGGLVVHEELDDAHTGAEHWGDILAHMNTEERTIYHLETYELHTELKFIGDAALELFNNRLDQLLQQWDYRTEHVSLGSSEASTGAWPLVRV